MDSCTAWNIHQRRKHLNSYSSTSTMEFSRKNSIVCFHGEMYVPLKATILSTLLGFFYIFLAVFFNITDISVSNRGYGIKVCKTLDEIKNIIKQK